MDYQDTLYCLKFDIPKNYTIIEFIEKMNSFMNEIQNFNKSIVSAIDETYIVESYIEDMEKGSIKWWIRDILYRLDDKAIDKFEDKPFKTTIASILKYAKYKAMQKLDNSSIIEVEKVIENKKEKLKDKGEKLFLQNKISYRLFITIFLIWFL